MKGVPATSSATDSSADSAVCGVCLTPIPYTITHSPNEVVLTKNCNSHGIQNVVLSTDPDYWRRAIQSRRADASRYAGGNGASSATKPHMVIVEALDECDTECPTCIASSVPGGGRVRSRSELVGGVRRLSERIGPIQLLMLSGGEPTLHPQLIEILQDLMGLTDQLMLITNGIRIAKDKPFVERLATLGDRFGVYLQFDSLEAEALVALRGKDFREVRQGALFNLQRYGVGTTLVSVIKRGVNEGELASTVALACQYENVRGVTFQPIRSSGRHADYRYDAHNITLSEIRSILMRDLNLHEDALIPHPLNPERICIGYIQKQPVRVELTSRVFDRAATYCGAVASTLYPTQEFMRSVVGDMDWLRIAIISFLDRHDYTTLASSQGGIFFLTEKDNLLPLDRRYMFEGAV